MVSLKHVGSVEFAPEARERVRLALGLQDARRLRPRFVDGRHQEAAACLGIHIGPRRGLEDRRGAVDAVLHRGQPPRHRILDGALDHQHLRTDEVTNRVGRILRPGQFLQRQHLVFQAVLVLVEQGPLGERRHLDQVFRWTERERRVLQRRLARAGARHDQERQRVIHLAAGHAQVRRQGVRPLTDIARLLDVLGNRLQQILAPTEPLRLLAVFFG